MKHCNYTPLFRVQYTLLQYDNIYADTYDWHHSRPQGKHIFRAGGSSPPISGAIRVVGVSFKAVGLVVLAENLIQCCSKSDRATVTALKFVTLLQVFLASDTSDRYHCRLPFGEELSC